MQKLSSGSQGGVHRAMIFEGISREAVEQLCSHGRVISFEANHELFRRGGNASELMILTDGVVELIFPVEILGVTRNVTMESKRAGDVVAWSALVEPYQYTLSARSATECALTVLSRETLHGFFDSDPQAGYLFMRNLAGVIGRRLSAVQAMWARDLQVSAAKQHH